MTTMLTDAVSAVTQHEPAHKLHDPQIRRSIAGWPRRNDRGFLAHDQHARQSRPAGCDTAPPLIPDTGISPTTFPEPTIAPRPDIRSRGIGPTLPDHTVTDAQPRGVTTLSLNVEPGNHAARNLYHNARNGTP